MSYAFSDYHLGTQWNNEVVDYLASKFNTVNPWIMVLSKSVFTNATLAKFGEVSFIINAANETLELSFAKVDEEKLQPVINEILKWDAFTKHQSAFYAKVDRDTSRSILFDTGGRQGPKAYRQYFHKYEIEIIKIHNKK